MAGLLSSFIPSLVGSLGGPQGILGGIKSVASSVLGDLAQGKVHSGSDFGQSLARGLHDALNPADKIDTSLAVRAMDKSSNAADKSPVVVRGEPAAVVGRPVPVDQKALPPPVAKPIVPVQDKPIVTSKGDHVQPIKIKTIKKKKKKKAKKVAPEKKKDKAKKKAKSK